MNLLFRLISCLMLLAISLPSTAQPPTEIKEIYPDLAISDFRIISISATEVKYTCTITNIGLATAIIPTGAILEVKYYSSLENAQNELSGPNLAGGSTSLPRGTLSPGKSRIIEFMLSADRRLYKICALRLDKYKKVRESNRNNNVRYALVPKPV